MKTKIIFLVGLFLLSNCHKNKPKVGVYQVSMKFAQGWGTNGTYDISITESNKNWIIVQGQDTLFKNKNVIKGHLQGNTIIGTYSRDGFSPHFKITGSFIGYKPSLSQGTSTYLGTFEIKKK